MAATATARSSAPARRAPARRPAAPARRAPAAPVRRSPARVAAVGGAVGGIADSGLFVWLTRGRLWIGLLGTLLVGIVGLNVMALSFSASSSNAGQTADILKRQNSSLRAEIAKRLSNTEVQDVAAKQGLVMPGAGSIGYLTTSAGDAKKAAERLRNGELTAGVSSSPVTTDTTAVATAPVTTTPTTDTTAVATAPVDNGRGHDRHDRSGGHAGGHRHLDLCRRRGRGSVNLIDRRVGLLFAAFVVLLGFVLIRAVWVQGVTGGKLAAEAQSQHLQTVDVPGLARGTIYDRTGRELAVSEDAATIYATPYQISDPPATAHKIAKILGTDQDQTSSRRSPTAARASPTSRTRSTSPTPTRSRRSAYPGSGCSPTAGGSTRRATWRPR